MRKQLTSWRTVTAVSVVALGAARALAGSTSEPAPDPPPAVVLELFTSQGCSSCPPAERLLNHLGLDETARGRVVPLAFHVDYWNQGGWVDPFGAHEWAERQSAYDRALGNGMYTPQLVVNGSVQFPGGNPARVQAEIAAALERPAPVRVSLTARRVAGGRPALAVEVSAEVIRGLAARKLQVLVALFENHLVTQVEHGENGGRSLQSDYVVRRLEKPFSLDAKPGARKQGTLAFKLDAAWRPDQIGVAAFAQDPSSMKIYGASAQPAID